MSVILILLPVVYLAPVAVGAAAAAVRALEKRSQTNGVIRVETRMKNLDLVSEAMQNLGYAVIEEEGVLVGKSGQSKLSMSRNADGLWVGQFSADRTEAQAMETLTMLDAAYGKLVQAALVKRLEDRAHQSNMQIIQQSVNQDQSITVTLAVNA